MATTKKKAKNTTKDDRIYIRVTSQIKADFETIADYRGLKSSTLLHSMIVNLIHEEKAKRPQIFAESEIRESAAGTKIKADNEQFLIVGGKKMRLLDEASSAEADKDE